MTDAGLVVSDRFALRSLGAVTSLDDFGRYADSAFALARSTFGHAETEEVTVQHMIGDYVVLATDLGNDTVAGMTILSMSPAAESPHAHLPSHDHILSWTLETEVLPGFYGRLLAANQPDTAGTPLEHLDRDAGDACSLLFALYYQSDD